MENDTQLIRFVRAQLRKGHYLYGLGTNGYSFRIQDIRTLKCSLEGKKLATGKWEPISRVTETPYGWAI